MSTSISPALNIAEVRQSGVSMTSREIAELTGKQHAHVMRDCRSLVEHLKADPNLDWHCESETYADAQGKERDQYRLDKNTTITLVSGYDPVIRMRIIKRWQELETQALKPALPDFTNPAEAARAWASEFEHKQAALAQLQAAQPAIEFHERVGDSDSLHSIDETAKVLRAPPMKFRKALKAEIQLYRLDGLPKQDYIDRGLVRVVQKVLPHNGRAYPQTFFTGKGLQWIQRKIDRTLLGKEV